MKSKKSILSIICIGLIIIVSCFLILFIPNFINKNNSEPDIIKEIDNSQMVIKKYESLNGQVNEFGKEYRTINISDYNILREINANELDKKLNSDENFYLFMGDEMCPWCRSVIESALESANKNNIDKIYYIEIWNDDKSEIFRDIYDVDEETGFFGKTKDGMPAYYKLLTMANSYLDDYIVKGTNVGEKRITAPSFFYIEHGMLKAYTTGTSELQETSNDELTQEIKNDQMKIFDKFFNKENCDKAC